MIAIVDYGAGNLASVVKAIKHLGREVLVTSDPDPVERADKLIIPGVGHFQVTKPLANGSLSTVVREAIHDEKPVLGICVGLQWMFEGSAEAADLPGLGAFCGRCERFPDNVKCPHVGWNRIEVSAKSRLLAGVPSGAYVYFTHSYFGPICADTVASCVYSTSFTAAAERDNLFGVQFHPEKSGEVGLHILENFCGI